MTRKKWGEEIATATVVPSEVGKEEREEGKIWQGSGEGRKKRESLRRGLTWADGKGRGGEHRKGSLTRS